VELERERLVGAGERGHVEEIPRDAGPVEHHHAALLAEQPFDRIGEHGDRLAELVRRLETIVAEEIAEAAPDADRARLQRDGTEVDQRVLVVDRKDGRDPAALVGRPVERAIRARLDPVDAPMAEPRLRQADPVEDRPHHRALGQPAGAHEFTEQRFQGVYPIAVNQLINRRKVNRQATQNRPVDNRDLLNYG